jgi:hypothetical protein
MPDTETPAGVDGRAVGGRAGLIDALAADADPDAQAEAWNVYLTDDADEHHREVLEARRVLNEGMPADAVALANRLVPERARAAVYHQTRANSPA